MTVRPLLLALALALGACARATSSTGAPPRDGTIGAEQLLQSGAQHMYDALQKLRPQCLRSRVASGMGGTRGSNGELDRPFGGTAREITVYVDGVRTGTLEDLRTMGIALVESVQCLSATDAAQRFGLNNTAGAIVLTMRRR